MAPRGINARRLIAALQRDGFELKRMRGSHRIYRHPDGRRLVVAFTRLSDTFPSGTLQAMLADTGWDSEDLRRLGLAS